jgi:bifunctional DNase/RNase
LLALFGKILMNIVRRYGQMRELEIESIRVRQETQQRAVVLRVKDSDLFLPIFVGHFEVEAIRLKLMDVDVQRPMTHDLLGTVIGNLGGSVDRIVVSELKNDTFYAKILVEYNGATIEIDSRPSDAIALAVRANAPIFAEEDVVEQAGVNLDNEIAEAEATAAGKQTDTPVDEEELRGLSAYTDFIDTLDLEDLGKDG